jgi:hypothetical protein
VKHSLPLTVRGESDKRFLFMVDVICGEMNFGRYQLVIYARFSGFVRLTSFDNRSRNEVFCDLPCFPMNFDRFVLQFSN